MKRLSIIWDLVRHRTWMLFIPFLLVHTNLHLFFGMLFMPRKVFMNFDWYTLDHKLIIEERFGEGYRGWQVLLIACSPVLINIMGVWIMIQAWWVSSMLLAGLQFVYGLGVFYFCGLSRQDIAVAKSSFHVSNRKDTQAGIDRRQA